MESPKKDGLEPVCPGCPADEVAPKPLELPKPEEPVEFPNPLEPIELPNPLEPGEFPKPLELVVLPNPLDPVEFPWSPEELVQPGEVLPKVDDPMDEPPIDDDPNEEDDPKDEPPPRVELEEVDCPSPAGLPQFPASGWFLESISTPAAFTWMKRHLPFRSRGSAYSWRRKRTPLVASNSLTLVG